MTVPAPEAPRFRIRRPDRRPGPGARFRAALDRLGAAVDRRIEPATPPGRVMRGALVTLLAWFTLRHLADGEFRGIYAGINLVLHEAGHLVFGWFGSDLLAAAGGTLFHLLCIVATGVAFWRQRDVFAVTVAVWWAGTLLMEAAPYAADARAQLLPLVSVGDGPVGHDWFTILDAVGLLSADQVIGGLLRTAGLALLVSGTLAGGWVVARMAPRRTDRRDGAG